MVKFVVFALLLILNVMCIFSGMVELIHQASQIQVDGILISALIIILSINAVLIAFYSKRIKQLLDNNAL
jgi:hypothetical protein